MKIFAPTPSAGRWIPAGLGALWLLCLMAGGARASLDPSAVSALFREAKQISDLDGGRFWGRRLYGPMLIVDPLDRSVVANQSDGAGAFHTSGRFYVGALPPAVVVSNTPIEWAGTRWTELMWPLRPKADAVSQTGDDWRRVQLAHEMFHRIQPALGLTRPEVANVHLDTREGRYLLQLEWRALARALAAPTSEARRAAVADALLFCAERYRLFPEAATREAALQIDEGLAEYTGVRLGLQTPEARVRYALYDLSAFLDAPTFVRSFPYASGPAYGLLLDEAEPGWRSQLNSGERLDQLLASAYRLAPPNLAEVEARRTAYDPAGHLYAAEVQRDQQRQARLAALRASLVDGPVLLLPLHHADYSFNPQTLQPLADDGTVYPTLRLRAEWGELQVDSGGALLDTGMTTARVSAATIDPSGPSGDGWRLTLNPGWSLAPGPRKGDLSVTRDPARSSR